MHHDRIGDSVKAMTIKGWRSLDTKVSLKTIDGTPAYSTVKELLLSLRASQGMVTHFLFHSIEEQVNSDFYLAVYAAENEELLEERLKSLAKDISTLLAPGELEKFFIDSHLGFVFGRDIRQYVTSDSIIPSNTSPSSALQLQRINQMVRSPSTKRTSASTSTSSSSRATRSKPAETTPRAAANMTTSYSSVTQLNTRSYCTPATSYTSSTANTEVSITIERRFVSIETTLQEQQQQQDEMNIKLDSLDNVSTESNILIKQLIADLQISPSARGSKRGKPGEDDDDVEMKQSSKKP